MLSLSVQRDRSKSIKKQTTDQSAVSALCRWRGVGPWRWSKPDTDGSLISPKLNKTSHWVWNGFQRLGSYMIEAQRCFICASSPARFWGEEVDQPLLKTHTQTLTRHKHSPLLLFLARPTKMQMSCFYLYLFAITVFALNNVPPQCSLHLNEMRCINVYCYFHPHIKYCTDTPTVFWVNCWMLQENSNTGHGTRTAREK